MNEIKIGDIIGKLSKLIEEHGGNFICYILPMIIVISSFIYIFFVGDIKFGDGSLFGIFYGFIFIWGCFIWIILLIATLCHIISKVYVKCNFYYLKNIKNIVLFKGKPEPKIDNIAILQIRDEFGIEI